MAKFAIVAIFCKQFIVEAEDESAAYLVAEDKIKPVEGLNFCNWHALEVKS